MIKLIKSTFYQEKATKDKLCRFIKTAKSLSMGDLCKQFEKKFSQWQNREFCTMVNSGSSANLILIQALININKIKKGDYVGFSAITWSTNVMPLIQMGLKPIAVDIEKDTLNCSLRTLTEIYKYKKIKMFFLTNLLGFSDDIEQIQTFCKKNNIILIEDNCEGLGSEFNHKKLGNFGLASTFSFFVGHHLSAIEGGAICTDEQELNIALNITRAHGWDRNLEEKEQKNIRKKYKVDDFYGKYCFYDLGFNLRPTEIQGFIGIEQLKLIDKIIRKREINFKKFLSISSNNQFIEVKSLMSKTSNFAFPVICKSKKIQKHYINKCAKAGIEIRPIVGGTMMKQPFFKKYIKENKGLKYPNANFIDKNGFYFGNNPEMNNKEINHIINNLKYE